MTPASLPAATGKTTWRARSARIMHPRLRALTQAVLAEPANLRWISHWLRHRRDTPMDLQQPWITFLATEWLAARIGPSCSVLEYGSGGSTLFFAKLCGSVLAVEHDTCWAASMRPALATHGDRVHLRVVPPRLANSLPIIPSLRYPNPLADFSDYVAVAHEFPDHSFDVISIDGRARCACIAACRSKIKPGGWLMLDNSERLDYSSAFNLLADWVRHDFFGLGLVNIEPWRTTLWQAPPA